MSFQMTILCESLSPMRKFKGCCMMDCNPKKHHSHMKNRHNNGKRKTLRSHRDGKKK